VNVQATVFTAAKDNVLETVAVWKVLGMQRRKAFEVPRERV
jgi:hypothetical protein